MNLVHTYDGAPLGFDIPATKVLMPSRAELGSTSNGGVSPEDPTAALQLVGWRPYNIEELDCAQPRLFTGWVVERNMGRSFEQTQFVGPDALIHDATITDLNALFGLRIITGTDGIRPEESVDDRVAWILSSNYLAGTSGTLVADTGYVKTGFSALMDECDYRGSYAADVFTDCSTRYATPINWFAWWDPAALASSMFFDYISAGTIDCTLSISNDLADLSSTCFAPITESRLERTPEVTYSDVIVDYANGSVHRSLASTAAAHIKRGTTISRPYIGKQSTAEAAGDAYLAAHAQETDRITTTIHVPSSQVGLIQAGMRMNVKFTHLVDYVSFTSMRIVACTPRAVDDLARTYDIDLELVAPHLGPQAAFDAQGVGHTTRPILPHNTTPGRLLVAVVQACYLYLAPDEPELLGRIFPLNMSTPWQIGDPIAWNVGSPWTTAYDTTQYGGPGPYVGCAIYWRRVQPGEITTTPLGFNNTAGPMGCYLWEFDTLTNPGSGEAYTTDFGYLANGGTASLGGTLTGFRLGAITIQQTEYSWEPQAAVVTGSVEVQDANDRNESPVHRTYWGKYWSWVGTADGPVEATVDYTMYDAQVVNHHGVAGAALELPGVTSVPTIPYPANQIVGDGAPGGGTTGGVLPTVSYTQATTDPTVTEDLAAGYLVGSTWINTASGEAFILVDNTTGAAVWQSTTTSGTGFVTNTLGGKEVVNTVAAAGSTETLDLTDGNVHDVTLTADCTLTFAGATAGVACSFTLLLRQDGTGGWVTTWPGSVIWPGGTAPTLDMTPSTAAVLTFFTLDGGTIWYGFPTGGGAATGRWELAVIPGSPPDPLYADGDFLYILVP